MSSSVQKCQYYVYFELAEQCIRQLRSLRVHVQGREVSEKESLSEFALHSFKTTTVIVAEGRLDYRAIFKYVSYQGS